MIRKGQRLGKYRIEERLGTGGFATVYGARDTVEGIPVALKIPHRAIVTQDTLQMFRKEVRIAAVLDHPNILLLKNAEFIGERFVIAHPRGKETLAQRLKRRMSLKTSLNFASPILEALSYAHRCGIIHCDIKPENFVIFDNDQLRLTDFGVAKVALSTRTIVASGSGTIAYMAPEQAFGKPSFASDVFSAGLVIYEMFSRELLEWPFQWPGPGYERLLKETHRDFVAFLKRSLELSHHRRYRDAQQMLGAFNRIRPRVLRRKQRRNNPGMAASPDWQQVRYREFKRRYGARFKIRHHCTRCGGPTSETMQLVHKHTDSAQTYRPPSTSVWGLRKSR